MISRVSRNEGGSAALLMLFVCLAVAVVLQAAWGTLLCAQRAIADESLGRQRMVEKDEILSRLSQRALVQWQPLPWTEFDTGEGMLSQLTEQEEWLLEVRARQSPSLSLGEITAWVERGRDGIDLPVAAVVADTATAAAERDIPWIGIDDVDSFANESGGSLVECSFLRLPAGLRVAPGCETRNLASTWRLDVGWRALLTGAGETGGRVAPTEATIFLTASPGLTQPIPATCGGGSLDQPALVVLTGGATLDARNCGDLYGVLVVGGGSVLLDGTVVHGAVFASGTVSLGSTGQVLFARDILRWATDRSLSRARLMPGTRREGME